jgi:quercetin dioxygenase-like cupin family protein
MEQTTRQQREGPKDRNADELLSQGAAPRHPTAATGHSPSSHHPSPITHHPRRIDHAAVPIVASPSGLSTQHLVSARDGAEGLFVAQQWLQPGDRVLLHTHPVEEAITFLSGSGQATLGDETVLIGAGVSLYIPAGEVHGFRCTGGTLHV